MARVVGFTRPRSPLALVLTVVLIPLAWGFYVWEAHHARVRWAEHWSWTERDTGFADGSRCDAGERERFASGLPILLSTTPVGRRGAIGWSVRWCPTGAGVSRVHYGFRVAGEADPQTGVAASPTGVVVTKQAPLVAPARAHYRWIIARHGCRSCTISFVLDVAPAGVVVHARHVG